jgi:5-methylcytosine-specific restriction enzyme A
MAWGHRESRQARGYGRNWERLRERVVDRDNGACVACEAQGRATPGAEVDHIIPKAKGGDDSMGNLRLLCTPCHRQKTAEDNGGKPRLAFDADGWPVW